MRPYVAHTSRGAKSPANRRTGRQEVYRIATTVCSALSESHSVCVYIVIKVFYTFYATNNRRVGDDTFGLVTAVQLLYPDCNFLFKNIVITSV